MDSSDRKEDSVENDNRNGVSCDASVENYNRNSVRRDADLEELNGACVSIVNHDHHNDHMNSCLNMDDDVTSPLGGLLVTPPRDVKTSTPSRTSVGAPGSWISPIHGLPSVTDDHVLIDMATLLDETANGRLIPTDHQDLGPADGSPPGLGSLRSLGLPGLTPLKSGHLLYNPEDDPCFISDDHISPNSSLNFCNQSFAKLLGDFHLDGALGDEFANGDYNLNCFGPLH